MNKTLILMVLVSIISACQLLHFLSPAAQNKLTEFSETIKLNQIGQTFSNVMSGTDIPYSIDVDSTGVPYIVFQNYDYNMNLYQYNAAAQNWVLKSTNNAPNKLLFPVLTFFGTYPYVAYAVSGNPGSLYNFNTPQAVSMGLTFGYYPDLMDYVVTPSGKHIVAATQNLMGTNRVNIYEYNGVSWTNYTDFLTNYFIGPISSIDLQVSSDNRLFLLVNSTESNKLFVLSGSSLTAAYQFDLNTIGISFAIDGADNIYYTYQNQALMNSSYYEIKSAAAPGFGAYYLKIIVNMGAIFNGEKTCAATKNAPYYFYTFAGISDGTNGNISILRLSPDGSIKNIGVVSTDMADMMGLKMACAPDGTLYAALAKNVSAINMITVWKIE